MTHIFLNYFIELITYSILSMVHQLSKILLSLVYYLFSAANTRFCIPNCVLVKTHMPYPSVSSSRVYTFRIDSGWRSSLVVCLTSCRALGEGAAQQLSPACSHCVWWQHYAINSEAGLKKNTLNIKAFLWPDQQKQK